MDFQTILVLILFLAALFMVARMIYRSMSSTKGCASNCGKCAASDFSAIKPREGKS